MSSGLDIAVLTFGVIFLLLGLIGQVKAHEWDVGTDNKIVRAASLAIGIGFIAFALFPDVRLPFKDEAGPWSGIWQYDTVDRQGRLLRGKLELKACGDGIASGVFENEGVGSGNLTGSVQDNSSTLTGHWINVTTNQSGKFTFLLTDDKKSFYGRYSVGVRENPANFWHGNKMSSETSMGVSCPPPDRS